ncbi:unnamed protein product [Alternaria sp. RS040]
MATNNILEDLTVDFPRLNLKNTPKSQFLHKTVQRHPTEIWRSDIWQACKDGILLNLQSELQNLRPQDVSRFVHARDRDGNTALIVASAVAHGRKSYKAIVTTLLAAGADINTKNQEGRTALMEASLLGGLAAVQALLDPEQGRPADVNLRDNMGLRAIDLAGTNAILGAERRRRHRGGEDQGRLFDYERRRRIIELLARAYDANIAYTSAHPRNLSIHSDLETNGEVDSVVQLEARLSQAQNETEDLLDTISAKEDKLRAQQFELESTKQTCEKSTDSLSKAKRKLILATRETTTPAQQSNGKNLQFRVIELKDGTFDTKIELIRTFRYGPRRAYRTGELAYSRPTIAYMDINGSHLARNGKLHEEGFIDSSYWVAQAQELFEVLGSTCQQTWFQHTEPQLMALCVCHFRQINHLTLDQFRSKRPVDSYVMPEVVEILVSREPCSQCEQLKRLVNKTTKGYNFKFNLMHAEAS